MLVWVIIAFIIGSVIAIIKIANEKQAIAIKVLLVGFVFFLVTAGYVYIKYDVDLSNFSDIAAATKIYFSWLGQIWGNVKGIGGHVIDQQWTINSTNISR